MKRVLLTYGIIIISALSSLFAQGDTLVHENFETGFRPAGWTEEIVTGPAEYFRYRNGGHNPNDPNNENPDDELDLGRNPDRAREGTYNAYFQKESTNNEKTKLVTPPIDLEFTIRPELRFWHAQVPWVWAGQPNYDILRVYYRVSEEAEWILLAEYLDPLEEWTQQVLLLPDPSPEYYVAFEAQTRWGHGVVIDEIVIVETDIVDRYVQSINITQASSDFALAGSDDNEVLRVHVKVYGNTGDLILQSLMAGSLNTNDSDIKPDGVKLYRTSTSVFSTAGQVGSAATFSGGEALLSGIDYNLPTGDTYFWVTYDVSGTAAHGNTIDGMIAAGSIQIGGSPYPASAVSPPGSRTVLETIFADNFEEDNGWILSGEFEIAVPAGGGGSPGGPNPPNPYSGTRVLGTDLTGLGLNPYKYEPGLTDTSEHYHAVSPSLDLFYYKDVYLRYRQWLNVEIWDGAYIEISTDGGTQWEQVWRNSNFVLDNAWIQKSFNISAFADRRDDVRIRFGLGETDDFNHYSGWNIDQFVITGEYITRDVGVTAWLEPFGDCGMSPSETIGIRVENFAAVPTEASVPVAYSLDGGATWVQETISQSIPVGGTLDYSFDTKAGFSEPGLYQVMARTNYPDDQEPANDLTTLEILSLPLYGLPYQEGFEGSSVIFWREGGTNLSWEHGTPAGTVINGAAEGDKAWVTRLAGYYSEEEASWVEGPCFDLSGNANPVFEMKAWWHTGGPADYASVLYSVDDRQTWDVLGAQGEGDAYSWNWYNSPSGWSGESGGWLLARNLMPPALVGQENVCFRIGFTSAAGEKEHEGFAFDDIRIYNVPHDVGVSGIVHPVSACAYAEPVEVTVEIENFGIETIDAGTEIQVGFDIDGENSLLESFLLQDGLPVGEKVSFTFISTVDLSAEGDFELTAYTLLAGDTDFYNEGVTNDTIQTTITLNPLPLLDLGGDIYTVLPDTVVLDAWAGVAGYDYLWHDNSTGIQYDVTEEGKYWVTATDNVGCSAADTVRVVRLIADIGLTGLVSPESSCELTGNESLRVTVHNFGTDTLAAGAVIDIYAKVDMQDAVQEEMVLAEPLLPGESMEYIFDQVYDFSVPAVYSLRFYTDLPNDNDTSNDTLDILLEVYGNPAVDLGGDQELTAWEYELDAGGPFVSYLWQDGSADRYYTADQQGEALYHVTVTDENGCSAYDEVSITLYILDMEIDSILYPVTSCGAPEEVRVTALFRNAGNMVIETATTVSLGYRLNDLEEVVEELVLDAPLEPGESFIHEFAAVEDLEEGNWYDFRVFVILEDDMIPGNDTMMVSVGIFEPPVIDLGADVIVHAFEYTVDAGPGYVSYLWHDGSTGQTFTVTETGINNVTVWVTDDNGCMAGDTKQVLLLITDIGVSDMQINGETCQGSHESLRVEVKNYSNTNISSSANIKVAYKVDDREPVIENLQLTSFLGAGSVVYHDFATPVLFGNDGVSNLMAYTIFASDMINDNDTSHTEVIVHPKPVTDIGNGQDELFTLVPVVLDAGEGFVSYLWQDGSTGRTFSIDDPVTGWFHVLVTDDNSCQAGDTVYVNFPEADLFITDVIVPGSDCELTGDESIGLIFENRAAYSLPEGEVIKLFYRIDEGAFVEESLTLAQEMAPSATITYTFSAGGDFSLHGSYQVLTYLEYEKGGLLYQSSRTAGVEVYGYPVVELAGGNDTLFVSIPVTLDAGSGYESYLWNDGSDRQTLDATGFGEYWVVVTDVHGCPASDTIIVESPVSVRMPAFFTGEVRVFPNPASERINVHISTHEIQDHIGIELTDIRGIRVYLKEVRNSDRLEDEIAVNGLPGGVYLLRVTAGTYQEIRRILIR